MLCCISSLFRDRYLPFNLVEAGTPDAKTPPTDFTLLNATDFQPVFLHKSHAPMPIALVNRAAHGTPDHADHNVPQNAAWLGGFRLAQHSIIMLVMPLHPRHCSCLTLIILGIDRRPTSIMQL